MKPLPRPAVQRDGIDGSSRTHSINKKYGALALS